MPQEIGPPNETDVDRIAKQAIVASQLVEALDGCDELDGTEGDLPSLQKLLDSGQLGRDQTFELQCLGIAFGRVVIRTLSGGFDWAMVEDEYGRDPAIRFGETSLLCFPMTMISKRIEDGEPVDILEMHEGLCERLIELSKTAQ